ncbi:hypothetical protein [Aestuariispira ectoiniformans]|nr:hypothetical protein [Aestuariispira ectoiniformans]
MFLEPAFLNQFDHTAQWINDLRNVGFVSNAICIAFSVEMEKSSS